MSNLNLAVKDFIAPDNELSTTSHIAPSAYSVIRINWKMLSLLFLVELSVIIWNAFDHSLPIWDCVNHRLNSFATYELLKHPHLHSIDWYRRVLVVSNLYPPLFYLTSAALKFVVGEFANTELLANLFFVAIGFLSIYYASRETYKSNFAALLAPILFFSYPRVYWSTHSVLLDCAANAMVAFSIASFIWWSNKLSLARTVLVGLIFGATVLTKNNTAAFLIGPFFTEGIIAFRRKDKVRLGALFILGLIGAAVVFPWAYLAAPIVSKCVNEVQGQQLASVEMNNRLAEFFENARLYFETDLAQEILSPLLCVCFIVSLLYIRPISKNKIFLLSSVFLGIFICSSFRWLHQSRYIVPCASSIAIMTAGMLAQAWTKKTLWRRLLVTSVVSTALFQVIFGNFTPYPLHSHAWSDRCMANLGISNSFGGCNHPSISVHPLPNLDWGEVWAIKTLELSTGNALTRVMVMPNADQVNPTTYAYLTKIRQDNLSILSGRDYAVMGDVCSAPPKLDSMVDWYILKTGDQGNPIRDMISLNAYESWCKFVRNSSRFELKYKKQLADGSWLELYRKVKKQI